MKYARLSIFGEKASILTGYAAFTKQMVHSVTTYLLSEVEENLKVEPSDIVIIDFSGKDNLNSISFILESFKEIAKIIIISPYSPLELSKIMQVGKTIDLLVQKPLDIDKFKTNLSNLIRVIDHQKMLEAKTAVFSEIVELNPLFISVFNSDGTLFYANRRFMDQFGVSLDAIDMINFENIRRCDINFKTITDKLANGHVYMVQREENGKWFESHFYAILNHYIVHVCEDITESKHKELQLEQASVFFEQSNEALMIASIAGKIISVNAAFCRITGYTKDEAIGKTPHILYSGMHDKTFYEDMWASLIHNGSWQGEVWNRRKNGEIYPEWLSINKASSSRYGEEFFISVFTDISSIKETDRKLYFYANHDPLTGLANRVNFENQLKKQLETCRRRSIKTSLMFIDLDKFKEVNDTYGHTIGDMMLKIVTKRLNESIRTEDFIARIGGDEFVIIAGGGEDQEGVLTFAKKLLNIIKEPITINQNVFFMSLSVGIAIYPDHGENAEDLIKHADAAMYEVKENGRNGCLIYDQSFGDKVSLKLNTQNELIQGIDNKEFELYYQPIIDLKRDIIVGAEALVRWNHPQKGLLYPVSFIGIVEESDYVHRFGKMVYEIAMHDMAVLDRCKLNNSEFKIAINVSAKQFFENNFVEEIYVVANDFGVSPESIELELLESQIMKSPEIAQELFKELSQKGFNLAMDDFGTGYSSLSYLKLFQLDKLKIDQSFVRDMLIDENDRAIIEIIISMGKIFKTHIHAEGVETKEHVAMLKNMGCDFAQGYYYTKPLPLNEFILWCNNFAND